MAILSEKYPKLVKEWHPTKNGDLTPSDVTHGSNKKVWWVCNKNHDYEQKIVNKQKMQFPSIPAGEYADTTIAIRDRQDTTPISDPIIILPVDASGV